MSFVLWHLLDCHMTKHLDKSSGNNRQFYIQRDSWTKYKTRSWLTACTSGLKPWGEQRWHDELNWIQMILIVLQWGGLMAVWETGGKKVSAAWLAQKMSTAHSLTAFQQTFSTLHEWTRVSHGYTGDNNESDFTKDEQTVGYALCMSSINLVAVQWVFVAHGSCLCNADVMWREDNQRSQCDHLHTRSEAKLYDFSCALRQILRLHLQAYSRCIRVFLDNGQLVAGLWVGDTQPLTPKSLPQAI